MAAVERFCPWVSPVRLGICTVPARGPSRFFGGEARLAEQLAAAMEEQGLTKVEMAARMKTSRRQLDRLFDPAIPSVTLDTLRRAANAVGRSIRIELV